MPRHANYLRGNRTYAGHLSEWSRRVRFTNWPGRKLPDCYRPTFALSRMTGLRPNQPPARPRDYVKPDIHTNLKPLNCGQKYDDEVRGVLHTGESHGVFRKAIDAYIIQRHLSLALGRDEPLTPEYIALSATR
jgi:hypothetical protein